MNYTTLSQRIETAGHGLCVGLDPDPSKLPARTDFASFCIGIIDATAHVAIAYKPNFAFFEALGRPGLGRPRRRDRPPALTAPEAPTHRRRQARRHW